MIYLTSKRLRVEIPMPGELPNTSLRFDRAGFVSEITLDGTVRFCASEPHNLRHPSSGGRGLCNEYRFSVSEEIPLGTYFPKFGIGLYRNNLEGKFVFHHKYHEVQPFLIDVSTSESSAVFETHPMPCQGFSMHSTKTITVHDNTLAMTICAKNVGERAMQIQEYCHNFISIDGMAIGSDYELSLPQCTDLGYNRLINPSDARPCSMRGNGKGIGFCEFSAIDTAYKIDCSTVADTIPFTWVMHHKGAHASVRCKEWFTPSTITIWAVDHIFCPEIVHEFLLQPGETHEWKREWHFDVQ